VFILVILRFNRIGDVKRSIAKQTFVLIAPYYITFIININILNIKHRYTIIQFAIRTIISKKYLSN
jgi:hypothetical protein